MEVKVVNKEMTFFFFLCLKINFAVNSGFLLFSFPSKAKIRAQLFYEQVRSQVFLTFLNFPGLLACSDLISKESKQMLLF